MILAAYRLGSWIPAPGVDSATIENYFSRPGRHRARPPEPVQRLGALALLAVRARDHAARHRLDHPAALTVVVPTLEQLQKEGGEAGYAKINQYTRYLTVVLGGAERRLRVPLRAPGRAAVEHRPDRPDRDHATAGTTLLMWMGELITKRGVGNGISLLIFASSSPRRRPGSTRGSTAARSRSSSSRSSRSGSSSRSCSCRRASGASRSSTRSGWWGGADRRRDDVPAAPREHGGRDPGHLRRRDRLPPTIGQFFRRRRAS